MYFGYLVVMECGWQAVAFSTEITRFFLAWGTEVSLRGIVESIVSFGLFRIAASLTPLSDNWCYCWHALIVVWSASTTVQGGLMWWSAVYRYVAIDMGMVDYRICRIRDVTFLMGGTRGREPNSVEDRHGHCMYWICRCKERKTVYYFETQINLPFLCQAPAFRQPPRGTV